MASPLSILKTVINLKHIHVESLECLKVPVTKFGQVAEQEHIIVHARPFKRKQCLCPICKQKCVCNGRKHKTASHWRAPNLNGVPVFIAYCPQRIYCLEHGALNEYIPWSDGTSRFTEDFNNEVAWMVCQMTKTAIAAYLGINWRTVGHCVNAAHGRIEPDVTDRLRGLRRICIDETSYSSGHCYITVVYDLDRNRVVWVHDKHGRDVFEEFCMLLTPEERERIEVVAGDGARWIDSCVKDFLPNAVRCVDFFHVVEWANHALDKVRVSTANKALREYNQRKSELMQLAESAECIRKDALQELATMPKRGRPSKRKQELMKTLRKLDEFTAQQDTQVSGSSKLEQASADLDNLLKGSNAVRGAKHALGHRPERRTENQTDTVKLIENSFPDLYRAYQLKEALRLILHMKQPQQAKDELTKWISEAGESELKPIAELSAKIKRHYTNIINSVTYQVNSAKSESTNTTIKSLIKLARGFRNLDNMISLIYLKCSDLVIPLNNRIQPTPEYQAMMRDIANERRRAREEALRLQVS